MNKANSIKPKILKGTRDFLPLEMAKRMYVMDRMRKVFMRFGYDTIETPVIEYAETLLGKYGEEGSKLLYQFEDNGGRQIALRYDQTVPTARFVAQYANALPMPFKRYQISRVWRADKPAKGRYREFYQVDIDVIGTNSVLAEAEICKMISEVMRELGFTDFQILVNSRKFINSVLTKLAISADRQVAVIQRIDKLEKIGRTGVATALRKIITEAQANQLLETITAAGNNQEKIGQLAQYDIAELREVLTLCNQFATPAEQIVFEPSLARGLDYYTGLVIEIVLPGMDIGSVGGGGRYEDLCGLFGKPDLSGVGLAFGFDRIVLAMDRLGLLQNVPLSAQAMVTYFDENSLAYSIQVMTELQADGVNTEMYFEPLKLQKQFKYANAKKIPFVIVCGPDEIANNAVSIKMMRTGKQKTIPRNQLTAYFNGMINTYE